MINAVFGIAFLFLPIAVTILGLVGVAMLVRLHLWKNVYRDLAKRYAGWLDRRWFLPQLRMRYRDVECRIFSTWSGPGCIRHSTNAQLHWPDRRLRLLICNPGLLKEFRHKQYGTPLQLPSASSPAQLGVITNQANRVESMLTPEVQWRLAELLGSPANHGVWIAVRRGRFVFHRAGCLRDRASLERLMRDAWRIYDLLTLSKPEGLSYVDENPIRVTADTRCPVCSQIVGNDAVICSGCETPHCRDCWEYNGACAVYACGEKRHVS